MNFKTITENKVLRTAVLTAVVIAGTMIMDECKKELKTVLEGVNLETILK